MPVPLFDTLFEWVRVDLVSPLEPSCQGAWFTLVLVDYATCYLEAVTIQTASAQSMALELTQIFSWVGIPKEVLTDQGTFFFFFGPSCYKRFGVCSKSDQSRPRCTTPKLLESLSD